MSIMKNKICSFGNILQKDTSQTHVTLPGRVNCQSAARDSAHETRVSRGFSPVMCRIL